MGHCLQYFMGMDSVCSVPSLCMSNLADQQEWKVPLEARLIQLAAAAPLAPGGRRSRVQNDSLLHRCTPPSA